MTFRSNIFKKNSLLSDDDIKKAEKLSHSRIEFIENSWNKLKQYFVFDQFFKSPIEKTLDLQLRHKFQQFKSAVMQYNDVVLENPVVKKRNETTGSIGLYHNIIPIEMQSLEYGPYQKILPYLEKHAIDSIVGTLPNVENFMEKYNSILLKLEKFTMEAKEKALYDALPKSTNICNVL